MLRDPYPLGRQTGNTLPHKWPLHSKLLDGLNDSLNLAVTIIFIICMSLAYCSVPCSCRMWRRSLAVFMGILLAIFELVVCRPQWPIDNEDNMGQTGRASSSRLRAFDRNYQNLYDPYRFDFRGFYWLSECMFHFQNQYAMV